MNNWDFYYNGWNDDTNTPARHGATRTNLLPHSRKGSLCRNTLQRLGLGPDKMKEKDTLWFYQLILPMCDIRKFGIRNDPRPSYYSKVETWTNIYAAHLGLGGSYSKKFDNIKIDKL
eukprot:10113286-Ditylum_brightwellii.AAC.1